MRRDQGTQHAECGLAEKSTVQWAKTMGVGYTLMTHFQIFLILQGLCIFSARQHAIAQ